MLDIHVIAINVHVNFCMNQCTSDKNCAIPGCAHVISSSGTCPATAPSARWLLYNSMPHPFSIQWVVGKVGQVRWGADPRMYRGEGVLALLIYRHLADDTSVSLLTAKLTKKHLQLIESFPDTLSIRELVKGEREGGVR